MSLRAPEPVATIVKWLTNEPPTFFGLQDLGKLELGAQADLVIIDPEALPSWDDNDNRIPSYRGLFEHNTMLSRSDGVIAYTFINSEQDWCDGEVTEAPCSNPQGRALCVV